MSTTTFHREDVKAILRKRYGSVEAFQSAKGLKGQQLRDFLRGKSTKALAAVAAELDLDPHELVITGCAIPICGIDSRPAGSAHPINEAAE